jgi:uncharacterized repeat protein (TIGR01451 family)
MISLLGFIWLRLRNKFELMKTLTLNLKSFLILVFLMSAFSFGQCPMGITFGNAVAPVNQGQVVTIASCTFLGEKSLVSNLVAGNEYSINIAPNNGTIGNGYFITIYNPIDSTVVISGSSPLSFSPVNSGAYLLQWNGPNCITLNSCHTSTISLQLGGLLPCTGQVIGGIAHASVSLACLGNTFELSVVGESSQFGLTYQWQSSSNGVNYTDILGANSSSYITSQSSETYYQCVVSCSNANSSSNSVPVFVGQEIVSNCVCQPQYINGCSDNDLIYQVVLNTMTNTSGLTCSSGSLGYSDYSDDQALSTTLYLGQNYNLQVSCGLFSQSVAAWIDFNDDGVFESPNERIGFGNVQGNAGGSTVPLIMPFDIGSSSNSGNIKMRVRTAFGIQADMITPCGLFNWGETEDYSILVIGDSSYACINGSVYCDNNYNGILDTGDVELANAPFVLNYNGTTDFAMSNAAGNFFFGMPLNPNATSATVSVDAAWLAQNGIQFTSNTITTSNLVCSSNSPTLNFPVNCDSSDIQTSCITGLVFCDPNMNGVIDSGEVVIPNAPIILSNGITIYTDSLGVFNYSGAQNPSGLLDLEISSTWLNNNGFALANNVFTVPTDCDSLTTVYIGIDCSPVLCSNLYASVSPWMGYFQNQNNNISINWGNYGPNATTGYALTLTFPDGVTPNTNSINNPNYIISGNTITWTFPANSSYFNNSDFISFFVPPVFPSGTPHTYTSTITALGSTEDCSTLNNAGALTMILGNSYDPNDKSSSQPPIINPDTQEEFMYVVRFQNTGTAPAQDVYILDTLSNNLDWSTLRVHYASHFMQLVDLGDGLIKFNFPGIWLPDSTANEPESHGKVIFSIEEKASNIENSVIENTAYIYFDWNEAIITNTTYSINAYPSSAGQDINSLLEISVFPNPTADEINIFSGNQIDEIQVLDITGKVIFSKESDRFNEIIDLSHLAKGVYLIQVRSEAKISTLKIVKE